MIDSGIFTLKTPIQLFEKLLRDHKHLKAKPLDADGWFNFVVTADHLPEWESGANAESAGKLRDQEPILRICNHLSRNAKHFKAEDQRKRKGLVLINPVAQTNEVQVASFGVLPDATSGSPSTKEFTLHLSTQEAAELGTTEISALELAERVVKFWRARLGL